MKWIKVKDELPIDGHPVLIYQKNKEFKMALPYKGTWTSIPNGEPILPEISEVTHWMKLCKPTNFPEDCNNELCEQRRTELTVARLNIEELEDDVDAWRKIKKHLSVHAYRIRYCDPNDLFKVLEVTIESYHKRIAVVELEEDYCPGAEIIDIKRLY